MFNTVVQTGCPWYQTLSRTVGLNVFEQGKKNYLSHNKVFIDRNLIVHKSLESTNVKITQKKLLQVSQDSRSSWVLFVLFLCNEHKNCWKEVSVPVSCIREHLQIAKSGPNFIKLFFAEKMPTAWQISLLGKHWVGHKWVTTMRT